MTEDQFTAEIQSLIAAQRWQDITLDRPPGFKAVLCQGTKKKILGLSFTRTIAGSGLSIALPALVNLHLSLALGTPSSQPTKTYGPTIPSPKP